MGAIGSAVALYAFDKETKNGVVELVERSRLRSEDITLTLSKPEKVTVVVKDVEGKPMPGVTVDLQWWLGEISVGQAYASTDSRGELTVDGLCKGGIYRPVIKVKGFYAPWDAPAVGSKEWTGTIEIRLERAARTQLGIVVDESGNPVANAQVSAYMSTWPQTKTGPDGRFSLEGLPDSRVEIGAYKSFPLRRGSVQASKDTAEARIVIK